MSNRIGAERPTTMVTWAILALNLPLLVIFIALAGMFFSEFQGVVNVTPERVVFFCALFPALPAGVLSLVLVGQARAGKTPMKPAIALTGIVLGVAGILVGLASWVWFLMVMSFVSAHSS